jgi:hypothetical protein
LFAPFPQRPHTLGVARQTRDNSRVFVVSGAMATKLDAALTACKQCEHAVRDLKVGTAFFFPSIFAKRK